MWALEVNEEAVETYKLNLPHVDVVHEDIITFNKSDSILPRVDILHAGFPCQSFSQAGNRTGFDDPRGKLFFEIITFIKKLGAERPSVLVFENSPHLMFGANGSWFDEIRLEIQRAGYWFGPENAPVIDARQHGGLPQRRERLFMVALLRDVFDYNPFFGVSKATAIEDIANFFETSEVKDDTYFLPENNKYGNWILKEGQKLPPNSLIQLRQSILRPQPPGVCPTLTANMGLGGHNVPFIIDRGRLRKLTELECLRLQGFEDGFRWPDINRSAKYRLIGNSVSPRVAEKIGVNIREIFEEDYYDDRVGVSA